MHVGLDRALLRQLVKERGGVDSFLNQWTSVSPEADAPPDRATLFRWMGGKSLPQNSEAFLRLAGLLDVDPFGLVAVSGGDIRAAAEDILRVVQNSATAPPWLQFVNGFFGRQKIWPPRALASAYFGRPWCLREFDHDPAVRSNFYARVLLGPGLKPHDRRPRVFHFAFKHPSLFHARWLQYGLVRVHGASATLHHINGHTEQLQNPESNDPVRVETWFGPGPALFRVASLHPFKLSVAGAEDPAAPALRFPG